MTPDKYAARREALRRIMNREGLNSLLVTHSANRYYLSGFELHDGQCNETSGCIVVMQDGKDWLCTDSRYEEAAAQLWDRDRVFIYRGPVAEEMGAFLRDRKCGKLGFESKTLSWDFVWHLQNGIDLEPGDGLVEELRVVKDVDELACIRKSVKLNHDMMAWIPSALTVGGTEGEVAWRLEKYFREHGATELSFPSIVAKDAHAALPHYSPLEQPAVITSNCHVLVDTGARYAGYCSDQTRTFWVGDKPTEKFLRTVDLVKGAQKAAIDAIRPGVSGKEIHMAARNFFARYGEENNFTHSLGHGVGLEVHEAPRLSPLSATTLQPGMIVTVEPGLYYPGWGGVRWEYMVEVTEAGCQIL